MTRSLRVCLIKSMEYEAAFALQRECVEAHHKADKDSGMLILLEHPPVVTIGRSGTERNILASEERLRQAGVSVHETNRGGDVTYHGPGQIVGYPILPLKYHGKDIHRYLRTLEGVLMATLEDYGIGAFRREGLTGVWTKKGKIVSIGVAIRHWITYHGFALNVAPNMDHFELIRPCGLAGIAMTSMHAFLGRAPERSEVESRLLKHFCEAFGFTETVVVSDGELCEMKT